MSINTSIYGNINQQPDLSYQPTTENSNTRNKKSYMVGTTATSYTSQLQRAVSAGTLQFGVMIDKSLCFTGLGTESSLSQLSFVKKTGSDYLVETESNKRVKQWFIWEKTNNTVCSYNRGSLRLDDPSRYLWNETPSTNNVARYAEPCTSLFPKNQLFLIRVIASNLEFGDVVNVDLKTFCESTYTTHPIVYSVFGEFYVGNSTPRDNNAWSRPDGEHRAYMFGYLNEMTYNNVAYINLCPVTVVGGSTHTRSGYVPIYGALSNTSLHFISNSEVPIFCGESVDFTINSYDTSQCRIYTTVNDINAFKQKILKYAACYCLYFTDNTNTAINGAYDDTDMYIGIPDVNGVGHGNFLKGAETINAPQNNWSDMHQSNYNPPTNADPTIYTNGNILHITTPPNGFTKSWVLNSNQVKQLATALYNATNDTQQGESVVEHNYKVFLTNNPIDCIISLTKYPIDNIPSIGVPENIKLGTYSTNITANPLSWQCVGYYFTFNKNKRNTLYPVYNDFRDYEPVTKCTLVVPFCGSVEMPTSYIYEYDDLEIVLLVDFITGACTAIIKINDNVINTVSGVIGQTIPVSGIQTATLNSQIQNIAQRDSQRMNTFGTSLLAGGISIGVAMLTGGLGAIATAVAGTAIGVGVSAVNAQTQGKQIDYELSHMQTPIKLVSSASPVIAQSMDMRCKMLITRPKMSPEYDESVYARTIGFACLINGNVSDFNGLTLGNICTDGINATVDEKNMITALFNTGVIL